MQLIKQRKSRKLLQRFISQLHFFIILKVNTRVTLYDDDHVPLIRESIDFMVQIIAAARDVQEKKEIYAPYNILPLDAAGASQAIMQLEEVNSHYVT